MKYKKSYYNMEFKQIINDENFTFIYNTRLGSLIKLDDKTYNIYDKVSNIDNCQDEFKIVSKMIEMGLVVKDFEDEYNYILSKSNFSRFSTKILSLTIAPTLNCNMRCPYCFEDKKNYIMDKNTQDNVILFINNYIKDNNIESLNITWYGGEPLLEVDTILYLSQEFIKICKSNNIKYKADMVSNGVLLSDEIAKILTEKCDISRIQITIDGLENTNNNRRKLLNNENSFNIIINNIVKVCDIINIVIRINIDKNNYIEIRQLLDYLMVEKKLLNKIYINFAPILNNVKSKNIYHYYSPEEFAKAEIELLEYCCEKNYIDITKVNPIISNNCCQAVGLGYYIIDPLGYMYTCWNSIGKNEYSIGHITKFTYAYNNYNYSRWLSVEIPEKCKKCKLLPLCNGGCPYNIVENNTVVCSYNAINALDIIKLKCKYIYKELHYED